MITYDKMDKYNLAAMACLNGLESGYNKLSASEQKELFGFNMVGRKDIMFSPYEMTRDGKTGVVRVGKTVCFGTDYTLASYSYEEFAQMITDKKKVVL